MNLLNIFAAGLLAYVPFALFAAAAYCFFRAGKQHGSGLYIDNRDQPGGVIEESKERASYWTLGSFWMALILLAAAIASLIAIASDYKGVH